MPPRRAASNGGRLSMGPSVRTKKGIAKEVDKGKAAGKGKGRGRRASEPARKGAKRDDSDAEEQEEQDDDDGEDDDGDDGDDYQESGENAEEMDDDIDSEDIDASDFEATAKVKSKSKRKAKDSPVAGGKKRKASNGSEGHAVQVVREIVKAPKVSIPHGQVGKTTMDFLAQLADPECNDREWFWAHDPVYRHALKNWNEFVDALTPELQKGDWTIPTLPSKDLVHRLARDVRFSNDKTPYKQNFSASFSRTGRKGPFAGYYVHIQPGDKSIVAAGKWGPEKNELATIRHSILSNPRRLRKVIAEKEFVRLFGPPKENGRGKGKRCNIFGADDALKNCPKYNGVTKDHKDIDLLKLRTIGVVHTFKDKEVLSPDFAQNVGNIVAVMAPLVQLLNEMIVPTPREDNDDDEGGEDGEGDGEEEGENVAEDMDDEDVDEDEEEQGQGSGNGFEDIS